MAIAIGEGGFNPLRLKPLVAVEMFFFFGSCAALLCAWRWPALGGAVALSGIILFCAVEFMASGSFPKGFMF